MGKRFPYGWKVFAAALLLSGIAWQAEASIWNVGDVCVAVSGGCYQVRDNTGLLKETICDGMGGFTTGCAFNPPLSLMLRE